MNSVPIKLFAFLLTLGLLSSFASAYKCGSYAYNYTMLVMDWPAQYCYHHQNCKPNWKQLIPTNQWTIRGFWPASKDLDFLNCIQYQGYDPNCLVAFPYNETLLSSELKVLLNTYWPEITTSNDIKSDQWTEHGTCYVSIVQTLNSSFIGKEAQIFQTYFRSPVQKVKALKLNLTQQEYKNKNDLAIDIGVKPEQFHALCEYDNDYLSQVRICYDVKGSAGNEVLASCPTQLPNECEFPAKIRAKNGFYLQFFGLAFLVVLVLMF